MSIDWAIIELAIPLLFHGLWTTLRICLLAILLGSLLGFGLGMAAFSRFAPARWAVRGYVDFVRGTPLLIQIFLVYFTLPGLGINLSEFWGRRDRAQPECRRLHRRDRARRDQLGRARPGARPRARSA